MIFTINNVSVGTIESCPYLTLSEALFLIDNEFVQSDNLSKAVYGGALFRFPWSIEPEAPKSLDEVEERVQKRRQNLCGSKRSFSCCDQSVPGSRSCKICSSTDNVMIVGVRNNDDFIETVVRCPHCSKRSTLDIDQAYCLAQHIYEYASEAFNDSDAKSLMRNIIDYIGPGREHQHDWVPLRHVLAPIDHAERKSVYKKPEKMAV